MKVFAPNYYKKFSCIADKCKHSCCIGWEIDIDDETFEQYKNNNTEFGRKLNDNIIINDDCACFKLTDNDRCPFLNDNNLCEIILNVGDSALCQICSDHPRFRNYYGNRVEIGLGLTCEEAARIIINENENFELIEIDKNQEIGNIHEDEIEFFNIRNQIFEIIENEDSFESIIEKLLDNFNIKIPDLSIHDWTNIYLNLEKLTEPSGIALRCSSDSPVPTATQETGSSATRVRMPVTSVMSLSSP
jgi:lysine-N-methylase